jgi:formylglycine-generating enzyme required for sulfatase activity
MERRPHDAGCQACADQDLKLLRGLAFVAVAAALFGWLSTTHDAGFRENMVLVVIAASGTRLLVSPYEVTNGDWAKCVADKGCRYSPKSRSTDPALPMTGVNWFDANEYLAWANARSGGGLRLPTKEEWHWLNRSLTRPSGPPTFTDPRLAWAADYGREQGASGPVLPQGSFSRSPDGIFDLDGNVWEWTMSCVKSVPSDETRCPAYYTEGAHEAALSVFIRDPASGGCATGLPPTHVGFRLVADQT